MNEQPTTFTPSPAPAPQKQRCNACGASLAASAIFCPECGRKVEDTPPSPAKKNCINCGATLLSSAKFCPSCGQAQYPAAAPAAQHPSSIPQPTPAPQVSACLNCGTVLAPDAAFCPKCGTGVSAAPAASPAAPQKRKISKKWLIIGIVAAVLVVAIVVGVVVAVTSSNDSSYSSSGTSSPASKLSSAYSTYCNSSWATLGPDSLSIDTNPNNVDDYINTDAYNAIKKVNAHLGLPSYLFDEMGKTTALMGRQTETFSSAGISVSWSYHPDNGLDVIYKVVK